MPTKDRFVRLATVAALVLLGLAVAQPYVTAFFFAATSPRPITPRGDLSDLERARVLLFRRVSPSVVQVVGITGGAAMPSEQQGGEGVKSGTGFVWDAAGDIVTNNHVVDGTRSVSVRFSTGEVARAEVLGASPSYDLAVLRVRPSGPLPPALAVGSSADLAVGQSAFAIGNPFGLDQSLTTGVISALKRRLPTSGGREIPDMIQTDAAINPGNSGGPLLDSSGRLIGVNTAIYSPSGANAGIGFAIPVDVVNRVVPDLIRTGRVPTPGIGIVAADESSAARLGIEGVAVVRVTPNSPAARAGLRGIDFSAGTLGDVIVGAGGKPIRRLADLTAALEEAGIGHDIALELNRGGRNVTVTARVADVSAG